MTTTPLHIKVSSESSAAARQQPVGPAVSSSEQGPPPSRVTLQGVTVTVQPLTSDHADALYDIVKGEDNEGLFTYLFDSPYASPSAFKDAVTTKSQSEDPIFFVIIDNSTSIPVGWAALMRIDAKHRVVEVGNILFSPRLQRTKAATEAMYLLARYVFEDLKYRRYEWKCDSLNAPSKRAAIRLGFTFEGTFRQHIVYKGRNRDTCWFSMVDEEWWDGSLKKGFEEWLDESNFDEEGRQRKRLEDIRGQAKVSGQRRPVVLDL